ncbi:MAG: hypothetical protein AB7V42_07195 [Thermoleophilia bacterium]
MSTDTAAPVEIINEAVNVIRRPPSHLLRPFGDAVQAEVRRRADDLARDPDWLTCAEAARRAGVGGRASGGSNLGHPPGSADPGRHRRRPAAGTGTCAVRSARVRSPATEGIRSFC